MFHVLPILGRVDKTDILNGGEAGSDQVADGQSAFRYKPFANEAIFLDGKGVRRRKLDNILIRIERAHKPSRHR